MAFEIKVTKGNIMKHLIILASLTLSGCSVLGDIEGTGKVGETIRAINKTDSVLTGRSHNSYTAAKFNRFAGQLKSTKHNMDRQASIQYIVRDMKELYRYLK